MAIERLDPPARLLLALCRAAASPRVDELRSELERPGLADALAELAQRHGLFGLVLAALEQAGLLDALPEPAGAHYRQSLRLLRRHAALWDLERDAVLGVLEREGIPAVLLKGAALRLTAYHDPVERAFGDLDLLVAADQVDAAVAALVASGYQGDSEQRSRLYREHHHHLILRKPMGFVVEVHWALEPLRSPFLLDPDAFRAEAQKVTAGDGLVRVPTSAHSILHLATQNVEDGFSRLGRMVDLDRLVRGAAGLDWSRLAAEAIRMRVQAVVGLSLRLAELLLDTPLPQGWLASLRLGWASRVNLALLDPVTLVLEQRSRRRDSLERLVRLWTIADAPTRWRVFRAFHGGEQDWAARFLYGDGTKPAAAARLLSTLKLGLYQLGVYGAALPRPASRRFWPQR
jgi:hypothetical protein